MQTTDIELEIYKFVVDNFMFGQAAGLGNDESLLQKGVIDSTGVLELVTFLQDNFKITVEDDEVIPANLETINGIVAYVSKKLNGSRLRRSPSCKLNNFSNISAQRFPDKVALVSGDDRYTYRQIDEEANRLAHALIASGVQRGDRVVIFLPNSLETVVSIFAALKAGAVFVVLNSTTKPDKVTYILNNCRATALVTSGTKADSLSACWSETPYLQSVFLTGASDSQAKAVQSGGKRIASLEEVRRQAGNNSMPGEEVHRYRSCSPHLYFGLDGAAEGCDGHSPEYYLRRHFHQHLSGEHERRYRHQFPAAWVSITACINC